MRYSRYRSDTLTTIWTLIGLNVLVFILTTIAPNLVLLLGLQPASFVHSPWTILTNMFVHGNPWHIIANMLTLYFFGTYLHEIIGRSRLLFAYFGGGILGNIMFILLGPQFSIAIGASGAIFALGGVLAVMRPRLKVYIFPIPVAMPLWIAVIGGFFLISLLPGIAWEAHLGGLVFGLVAGYFFKRKTGYSVY